MRFTALHHTADSFYGPKPVLTSKQGEDRKALNLAGCREIVASDTMSFLLVGV